MKRAKLVLSGVVSLLMVTFAVPGWAEAKQTSLDSRIIQAFENIDERTNTHERDVVNMRARLDNHAKKLKGLRSELAGIPSDTQDPSDRKLRRILHGIPIGFRWRQA